MDAFYPSLNDFCRRYLVAGHPLSAEERASLPQIFKEEEARLFEQILLFDRVSIKVHGENIPLVFLLKLFGQKGVEALVEQGALRFVLWTPTIVHMVTELPGINAIASGYLNSPPHSDPEQSIDHGLGWLGEQATPRLRRLMRKKIAPLYVLPSQEIAQQIVETANSAFMSGKLTSLGLDPQRKRIDNLALEDRALFAKAATDLLEYQFVMDQGMTSLSNLSMYRYFSDSLDKLNTADALRRGYAQLSEIEDFPNLQALYLTMKSGFLNIPKLRHKRSVREFRKWLATATSGNKTITREYLDAITERRGLLDSASAKFFKALAFAGTGVVAGLAVEASPLGATIGGLAGTLAGKAAEPVTDFTLDLLDNFLLEKVAGGWHPRMFFDDLRKLQPSNNNERG